jgi:hypothetical protein
VGQKRKDVSYWCMSVGAFTSELPYEMTHKELKYLYKSKILLLNFKTKQGVHKQYLDKATGYKYSLTELNNMHINAC